MIMALLLVAALAGCGDLERDNLLDPHSPQFVDLPQLLIGSWARNDEKNEIYIFNDDGSVELRDYTECYPNNGPDNPVDRSTALACYTLLGIYSLNGDELRISFNTIIPQGAITLPRTDKVATITIRRNVLTLVETDGTRFYTRTRL